MFSLLYRDEDEPWQTTAARWAVLAAFTWAIYHAFNVLSEVVDAVDWRLAREEDEASGAAAAAGAAPVRKGGSLPYAAGPPVRRAGWSVPKVGLADGRAGWAPVEASCFRVRCGPNYKKNGLKAPSGAALGEVVAFDCFKTDKKCNDIVGLGYLELPPPTAGWKESYPELLIINQQLSVHFNSSLMTDEKTDGETLHLVTYVRLPAGLGPNFDPTADPSGAAELLKRFAMRAEQVSATAPNQAKVPAPNQAKVPAPSQAKAPAPT